jgi:hypothetical protein
MQDTDKCEAVLTLSQAEQQLYDALYSTDIVTKNRRIHIALKSLENLKEIVKEG